MSNMQEVVLIASNGVRVLLEVEVLKSLKKYRQVHANATEAGGVLIGEYRGGDLRILAGTEPGGSDKRSRFGFKRRSLHHGVKSRLAWVTSGGRQNYIGDWHTHPEANPKPSGLDIREWRRNLPLGVTFVIIVGTQTNWYGLWVNGQLIDLGC
jgi:integrative and conjugative element protein (TIGR02256 family)